MGTSMVSCIFSLKPINLPITWPHALSLQSIDLLRQTQFQLSLRLRRERPWENGGKNKEKTPADFHEF